MSDEKLCPHCGKRTMVKKKLANGKFTWVCTVCGLQRGEFKEDKKKGVV
jgi:transcription elongation factor Elf1